MTQQYTLEFYKLNKKDIALAGGKGASLGEMTQVKIPVPKGFVILSNAFEKFLQEKDLIAKIDAALDAVNAEEVHTVEKASQKIEAMIMDEEMPKDIKSEIKKRFKKLKSKFVAVRSSATSEDSISAAWAGQLETYLNTNEKELLDKTKKCWASLFTPRAIAYRFMKNLRSQKISVAVVVQKMVESEKSGVAFSVHPVMQDRNQLIIEAIYGLGEGIVSGSVTPNSYIVEKNCLKIIDKKIAPQTKKMVRGKNGKSIWQKIGEKNGKQSVLNDNEVLELSKLIIKIEKHYGFPVDIEWAKKGNYFYILQSRPITTLQ